MFGSSIINDSFLLADPTLINYNFSQELNCFSSSNNTTMFKVCFIVHIFLLLPLSVFILFHGIQLWRQRPASAAPMSHSDCFTYHVVYMELINIFGIIVLLFALDVKDPNFYLVYTCVTCVIWHGQTLFHLLTCVERYLAVALPVMYMKLKNRAGVRWRNILILCVWFLCFSAAAVLLINRLVIIIFDFCLMVFVLAVVSFCSASVLRFLILPGPGELKGNRERVDQSKQRAFYTIVFIMAVLLLRFCWGMVWAFVDLLDNSFGCLMMACSVWFQLPSSLVLPLLYLHRAGMFRICKPH